MSDRVLRLCAWGSLGAVLACVLLILTLSVATDYDADLREVLPAVLVALSFAVVGAVVAAGAPRNSIGWLLLGIGLGIVLLGVTATLGELEIASPGSVPGASVFAWLSTNVGFATLVGVMALLPRLPSGTLPSPRWRRVNVLAAVAFVVGSVSSFAPGPLDDHPELENPFGIPGIDTVAAVLEPVAVVLLLALLLVSVASVFIRFRRARGIERLQLKWVASAITVTVVLWFVAIVFSFSDSTSLLWVLWSISLCAVPASIGVAVRRYRLYELDRVVSRTLVYGALTVILGVAYAGLVLAGQWLFSSFAGGSNLAIAGSTLVVAALFLPVRGRVQGFVDRRFYRHRYDAQRTLETFGARLRDQVELQTLRDDLGAVVEETMRPTHVSLWLRQEVTR